jgi:hypothetical protein
MNRAPLKLLGWMVVATALLSGCATGYLLDNNVQSFSYLTALPAQPGYRFERLPSQQAPFQAALEAFADAPLFSAGLRRDDANPVYSVQVSARVDRVLSPWADPWSGWGWGGYGGWGMGRYGGIGFGTGFGWGREPPWYHREVAVIIREISSGRVVYETHASNEGPWLDDAQVFPAMLQAALQGFPQPPAGPRRVDIPVGR